MLALATGDASKLTPVPCLSHASVFCSLMASFPMSCVSHAPVLVLTVSPENFCSLLLRNQTLVTDCVHAAGAWFLEVLLVNHQGSVSNHLCLSLHFFICVCQASVSECSTTATALLWQLLTYLSVLQQWDLHSLSAAHSLLCLTTSFTSTAAFRVIPHYLKLGRVALLFNSSLLLDGVWALVLNSFCSLRRLFALAKCISTVNSKRNISFTLNSPLCSPG